MKRQLLCGVGVTVLVSAVTSARGSLIIDSTNQLALDVALTVGEGTNTSYMIVDFAETGGASYAFAYRWNDADAARSYDMISAIADASAGFGWTFGGTDGVGFGAFVENFTYNAEAGDAGTFWSLSLGTVIDPGVDWTSPAIGISQRFLTDGSIDGWYNGFTPDFASIPPEVPTVSVPSPAAGFVMLGLAWRRRRRAG
ncbi:MAG: hypothetical protein KC983_00420 [Phycisphaerales bacterium]|nr:hypothetical protein [Phycisphaerales bacterium]